MQPEETYLAHLVTIERIAAFVARRSHLNADDTAEFIQEVRVRLLEDDYAIIRKFEGRSSFSTYLTTVILRLHHQWRVELWGKWRPSAEARRLGEKAITLERLLTRDNYTIDEAVQVLTTRSDGLYTEAEVHSLYARLPFRAPRPVSVSDELLPESIASQESADERLESRDRALAARTAAAAIDEMLGEMPAEDRLILQMRFWHALKVPEIAQTLHLDQKKIYKRLDRIFAGLRRGLEQAGVDRGAIAGLLCRGDQELSICIEPPRGIPALRPSHVEGSESIGAGEGRVR